MSKLFAKGLPGRKKAALEPESVPEPSTEPELTPIPKAASRKVSAKPKASTQKTSSRELAQPVKRAAARKKTVLETPEPPPDSTPKKPGDWFLNTEWKSRLREFVKSVLVKHVFVTQDSAAEFFDFLEAEDHFFPFYSTFVHYSVDPENDYDVLEKIGDSILKACFIRYLYALDLKYQYNLAQDGINDYVTVYLGTTEMVKMSKALGLPKYVLVKGNLPKDIGEDVLEAFIGALCSAGEVYSNGYGWYVCQRFVESITKSVMSLKFSIAERAETSPPATWFKEIYDQILPSPPGAGAAEQKSLIVETPDSTRSEISLQFVLKPGALFDLIKQQSKDKSTIYPNYVVASAVGYRGQDKDEVEVLVYQNARKVFVDWGFDNEFIKKLRLEKNLAALSVEDRKKYTAKLVKESFVSVETDVDTKVSTHNDYTINLVGIRRVDKLKKPNSTKLFEEIVLDSFRFKGDRKVDSKEQRKEILQGYLKKKYQV